MDCYLIRQMNQHKIRNDSPSLNHCHLTSSTHQTTKQHVIRCYSIRLLILPISGDDFMQDGGISRQDIENAAAGTQFFVRLAIWGLGVIPARK